MLRSVCAIYINLLLLLRSKEFCLIKEEEIDDLASQVQLLEQSKIKLEMAMASLKKEHRREMALKVSEELIVKHTSLTSLSRRKSSKMLGLPHRRK